MEVTRICMDADGLVLPSWIPLIFFDKSSPADAYDV